MDAIADKALFDVIRAELRSGIELLELDANVNDPSVADAICDLFDVVWRSRQSI